jgi:hypothetical protein
VVQAALMVSLLSFLNVGGDGNHDVGSPFHHYSSLPAFKRKFTWLYDIFLSP